MALVRASFLMVWLMVLKRAALLMLRPFIFHVMMPGRGAGGVFGASVLPLALERTFFLCCALVSDASGKQVQKRSRFLYLVAGVVVKAVLHIN
jgi:hypothetical protein